MKSLRHLFFLLLATLPTAIWAQPEIKGHQHNGCGFYHMKLDPADWGDDRESCGSNARSDSIDILNYDVTLDVRNFTSQIINASCTVTFSPKQDGLDFLPLDLLELIVDSVVQNGTQLTFDYDTVLLNIHLPNTLNVGDTAALTIYYHGKPKPDPSWGGFVFENGYAYNLGIGLNSNPYNMGRSWHPCFDNFVERATYDIGIISDNGRKGYAIGQFLGETDLGNGAILRQFRMDLPLPTYLVGSATSTYGEVRQQYSGQYGDYPMVLVGKTGDTTQMKRAFKYLDKAVEALEAWFGPYRWGQVGYVLTTDGAMEHASLIAYPDFTIDDVNSTSGEPGYGMNRLMAHELGHHWWGNVTTLSCPSNMWIKEGNAEYNSHLFQEFVFGKEYFRKVVKDNNAFVVKNAHLDDGGYLPLSGLPYENTYGTHTYQKGAAIMHNLRGYLGDSLFQKGMTSILETYEYQSVDAELFRDQLTVSTGVDMTPFFDDWIFSPGYAVYELDSVQYAPAGNGYEARLFVQQKLHHNPHLHTNAPMEITFFDENWQSHTTQFMASGEFTEATVDVPFQPIWQVLNDNNLLNLARLQDRQVVKSTGNVSLSYCDLSNFQVTEIPAGDSALVSCIHYLSAADPDPSGIQLSTNHYWRFGGDVPQGFKARVTLNYRGASDTDLDHDLTNMPEDSLTLVWRPRPGVAWGQYPYYKKFALNNGDGNGFIRIDTLLMGDYAFAAGSLPVATGVFELGKNNQVEMALYPNPASTHLTVQSMLPTGKHAGKLVLHDAIGSLVKQSPAQVTGGLLAQTLDVSALQAGIYFLQILDENGALMAVEKFVKD
jgi:aminopeptidase N